MKSSKCGRHQVKFGSIFMLRLNNCLDFERLVASEAEDRNAEVIFFPVKQVDIQDAEEDRISRTF